MTAKRYPELTEKILWESDEVRLVRLYGLKQGPGHYTNVRNRVIKAVIIHHADSSPKEGQAAPRGIANFHAGQPKYKRDAEGKIVYRKVGGKMKPHWIGGGRGWPGIGYQAVVPTIPELQDGKAVVYQTHDDETWSWHTGASINRNGFGICMAGCFRSEHYPDNPLAQNEPDPIARKALEEVVTQYYLPRFGLKIQTGLKGHFDYGKPACPGDWLEQWVRHMRGEAVPHPEEKYLTDPDPADQGKPAKKTSKKTSAKKKKPVELQLKTAKERQEALLRLGYDLGPWGADGQWGAASKGALLAFQETEGLKTDGVYGPMTEAALLKALERQGD